MYNSIGVNYLPTALHQADKIMYCMHKSTGTRSSVVFAPANTLRTIPLPIPNKIPIGPLKLSNHPGKGSVHVEVTASNRIKLFENFCRKLRSVLGAIY